MKKIICPNCGAEYSVSEIFIPNEFVGNIHAVEKDSSGHIISNLGKDMDLKESYICDYCNSTFNVKAKVEFECKSDTSTFTEKYTTKINRPHLIMEEE